MLCMTSQQWRRVPARCRRAHYEYGLLTSWLQLTCMYSTDRVSLLYGPAVFIRPKQSIATALRANYGNTLRVKNGVHAFGYNSAECEPICMKSSAPLGAGLADFGRDPRSCDSLRGSRILFFLLGK